MLRIADLDAEQLRELLDLAEMMKAAPADWCEALRAETLLCAFDPAAGASRVAFAAAAHRLGMLALDVRDDELRHGEPLADDARMLSQLGATLVVRTRHHATLERIAAAATVPVISAGSDMHDPSQALAALLTLRERFGGLAGLRVACVGEAGGATHALLEAAGRTGMRVVIAAPQHAAPDAAVVRAAARAARATGGHVKVTDDPYVAVRGAQVVYSGDRAPSRDEHAGADEAAARRADRRAFRVDAALMHEAAREAIFLHGRPARRGDEVTDDVFDGPASRVWQLAENRLPVAQALVYTQCTGDWTGALGHVPDALAPARPPARSRGRAPAAKRPHPAKARNGEVRPLRRGTPAHPARA